MHPYFYLGVKPGAYREVDTYLRRRFQDYLADVCKEEKVDLEQVGFQTILLLTGDAEKPLVWDYSYLHAAELLYRSRPAQGPRRSTTSYQQE